MATFIKKYRDKRVKQKISLEDLNKRTKISVKHLEAIEKGNFEILPKAYVRLFFKAYVTEIGSNSEEALTELDQYFSKDTSEKENKIEKAETPPKKSKHVIKKVSSLSKIKQTPRSKIVNGIILLLIWIFAIIIIRKITISNSQEIITAASSDGQFVTIETLLSNFQELSTTDRIMDIQPPYTVTVVATNQVLITTNPNTEFEERNIIERNEQQIIPLTNVADFILNNCLNSELYINGESIQIDAVQPTPVRIMISENPLQIRITHFTPLN
jgi:cytoskeletal protein RodZ